MRLSTSITRNVAAASTVMLLVFSVNAAAAQSPSARDADSSVDHTAREEAEGKDVWWRLQAKEITCADLSEENYGVLGEYFMGLMFGDTRSHEAMNRQMTLMMGEAGEEQMHVAMGKRLSGCDVTAAYGTQGRTYVPGMMGMMGGPGMMWGASGAPYGMMGYGAAGPWYWTAWIKPLLAWTVLILLIVALLAWISKQKRK